LVAAHLATNGHDYIDVRALRYMLGRGRVVLLFDGFDELVARVTYERAADHLETLLSAAKDQAKVVVASRTQHFQSHQQVLSALGERVGLLPTRRVLTLDEFSPDQIREHLVKRFEDEEVADARLQLINAIPDLAGLVRNPRMLGFVLDLGVERLQAVTHATGTLSAAGLYAEVIDQWLGFEENRTQGIPGAPVGLGVPELRLAVTRLAVRLWETAKPYLEPAELLEVAAALEHLIDKPVTRHQAAHAVGAGSLLVRSDEGMFGFIHSSVMEWLVAGELARQMAGDVPPPLLRRGRLSQLTVDFTADLADPARCGRWATEVLSQEPPASETARANAFALLSRLRTPARTNLRGLSLAGENLSTRNFSGVDLSGADLTGSRLVETDLTGAVLTGTALDRARLDRAVLDGADVSGATFTGARLLSTSLRGTRVSGGDWRHAVVAGAVADEDTLDELARLGAAIAPRLPVRTNLAPSAAGVPYGFEIGRYPQPVAYDPLGATVAFGADDGGLVVCDARSGRPLRTLDAHRSRTYFVAYRPDGAVIATGGADAAIRLWDSVTGEPVGELTGHGQWVWPVVFSGDSRYLAAGGSDGVVRVYEAGTGRLHRSLEGHSERVWAMGFTPDGDTLAVADDAGARLWDLPSGRVRTRLGQSRKPVYVLACSPDGEVLATGESTGAVRLWDPRDGEGLADLAGHTAGIYAVAFRADGGELVTGDRLGGVRLWDRDSGWAGRSLTEHRGAVYSVAFGAPDLVVTADSDGVVRLFRGGRLRHELTGHRASVWPVAVRPDGGQLATSSSDDSARLWNTATGAAEMHLRGHSRSVGSVGFTADGGAVAAASTDGAVRLWDVRTGALRTRLRDGDAILVSATTSPTHPRIATATPRGDIQLWNAVDGGLERKIAVETDGIWAEAFDHQGQALAVAADDDTVQLFYPDTGRRYEVQQQHR
ncbi:MAG: hypothetical protein HOY78_07795, partial [Saccharothrix sp.]|nr:hypothetical protein [Saccharothrix sp.]